MKEAIINILSKYGDKVVALLVSALSALGKTLDYLENKRKDKKEEIQKKEEKELDEKIKDTVDNGTIEDLLNLKG